MQSAGVALLWRSALLLVASVTVDPEQARPSGHDVELWMKRYRAALARFASAGIATVGDEEGGFARYVDLRGRWDGDVHALPMVLAGSTEEVDPPLAIAARRT